MGARVFCKKSLTISAIFGIVAIRKNRTKKEVIVMSGKLNHYNFIMSKQNRQAQSSLCMRIG